MLQLSTTIDRGTAAVEGRPAEVAGRIHQVLVGPFEAAAFWAAVVLPFLHVPLLLSGLGSGPEVGAFVLLVALNLVAVVLGHPHHGD